MLEMKDVDDKSEMFATDLILFVTNIVGVLISRIDNTITVAEILSG